MRPTRERPTRISAPPSTATTASATAASSARFDATRSGRLRVCTAGDASRRCPAGATTWSRSTIPNDALGSPIYKVTREEDINIGNGDEFVPAGAAAGLRRCRCTRWTCRSGATPATLSRAVGPRQSTSALALRGHAEAAVRRQAGHARPTASRSRPRSTSSPTCRSRAGSGSSSSTTSTSRATRSRSPTARRPACRSCRWASTTTPTGSSRPSSPTTTACPTCCCRRPTASTARRPPVSAPTCTASSATTRAFRGA